MQWTDEGIVLGVKRHGEANAILELMTREHGRHLGLVRGGFGSRLKPVLQPGNTVSATWRARLDEHLGNYTVEGSICAPRISSPPARDLWRHASRRADAAAARARPACRALRGARRHSRPSRRCRRWRRRWWCALNCSFWPNSVSGLISTRCAATGAPPILSMCRRNRAGRCRATAGEPWADKMLRLPAFLRERGRDRRRPRSRRRLCAHRLFSDAPCA